MLCVLYGTMAPRCRIRIIWTNALQLLGVHENEM